jgi:hypothetical protein
MKHDHHQHCAHVLAFCEKCDVPYCSKCNFEWAKPCNQWHYNWTTTPNIPWYTTTGGTLSVSDTTSGLSSTNVSHLAHSGVS